MQISMVCATTISCYADVNAATESQVSVFVHSVVIGSHVWVNGTVSSGGQADVCSSCNHYGGHVDTCVLCSI